jgi:hypothetical protein
LWRPALTWTCISVYAELPTSSKPRDIRHNQVLGAAAAICAPQTRNAQVRSKAQILLGVLEEACDWSELDHETLIEPFEYDRLTSHYRTAHKLAQLILETRTSAICLPPAAPVRSCS